MVLNLDKKVELDTLQLNGVKYSFIQLSPAAKYNANEVLNELKIREVKTVKEEAILIDDIHSYLTMIIDAPKDVLDMFEFNHFVELVEYLDMKPLLDQGFTERKIKELNRKAMERFIDGDVKV